MRLAITGAHIMEAAAPTTMPLCVMGSIVFRLLFSQVCCSATGWLMAPMQNKTLRRLCRGGLTLTQRPVSLPKRPHPLIGNHLAQVWQVGESASALLLMQRHYKNFTVVGREPRAASLSAMHRALCDSVLPVLANPLRADRCVLVTGISVNVLDSGSVETFAQLLHIPPDVRGEGIERVSPA